MVGCTGDEAVGDSKEELVEKGKGVVVEQVVIAIAAVGEDDDW